MSWSCPVVLDLGPGVWVGLLALGAYHGVNPGMGWLFAVALGLQEGSRRAVLAALAPIALGHLVAVATVVAVAILLGGFVPAGTARGAAGGLLVAFGAWRLRRPRHPRWVGFRVGGRELVLWSALMSTGHGAGLMLLPFLLGTGWGGVRAAASGPHVAGLGAGTAPTPGGALTAALGPSTLAVAVHTAAYLAVLLAVALVVYERLGVAILRRAWYNLDRLWAGALVAAGLVTMLG
jgi:hypothetical protein